MISRSPVLAEVLNAMRVSVEAGLRVALPGRVQSFDPTTQLASVQPMIQEVLEDEDGNLNSTSLPIVSHVPVLFPGGGGLRITFPVAPGDFVWLSFGDRTIDGWLNDGNESSPDDLRRHNLSDAVAVIGLHPNSSPWHDVASGVITLGDDVTPGQFVALANLVLAQLNSLATAFSTWVPVPGDGGTALKTILTTLIGGGWPASVASATVKVKG